MRHVRPAIVTSMTLGVVAAVWPRADAPILAWNASSSVPIGLYVIVAREPKRGELAVLRLPKRVRSFANTRGYLALTALLIKPVATTNGDIVCRYGSLVAIDGRPSASARTVDDAGRPLPKWSGCHRLDAGRILIMSAQHGSFDGRYFGPVDARHVLGTAIALWTR